MSDTTARRVVSSIPELRELIGQEIWVSDWETITQERVNLFAEATGDFQYIHIDPERAKETFFGGTVAHGFLTLSLALENRHGIDIQLGGAMEVNYGLNKVRFPAPVPVGKQVRSRTTLVAVDEIHEKCVQLTTLTTIDVEGQEKPGCVAEGLFRTYF
jgi:acyl dehydratase